MDRGVGIFINKGLGKYWSAAPIGVGIDLGEGCPDTKGSWYAGSGQSTG
jgi:hypothetical protein